MFVSLLQCANKDILAYIVEHDQSIVTYALNKVPLYLIKFYMNIAGGKREVNNLNAFEIKEFMRQSRPDLLEIIDKRPGWLEREVNYAREVLQKL